MTPADEAFMRRALRLARRGQGAVEPNPMVGCVIVKRRRVIGEGWHRRFGGPHAEIEALRRCVESPRGATVYVTLEPCCFTGKTPPCTDALIAAGVGRVVAAMADPNPLVAGRGFRQLRTADIAVEDGVLRDDAVHLNAPFVMVMTKKRPWVILKWAQSLDGKIATRTGDSKWISDAAARAHAHATRGRVDGILVGVNTVLRDDPRLTCRDGPLRRVAARLVLDSTLRTPLRAALVRTARTTPTWIFHDRGLRSRRMRPLADAGCRLVPVARTPGGLSLSGVLRALHAAGMSNVLVEGGGTLLGRFFDAGLADEAHVYIAPCLIGGGDAPSALGGRGVDAVARAWRFVHPPRCRRLGDGWFVQGRLRVIAGGQD